MARKAYFTASLDLVGRGCLIIGGTEEALEKIVRFLDAESVVTVVSPRVLPELEKIINDNNVKWEKREYQPGDEEGMFFVLNTVKTDPPLSKLIFDQCKKHKILISSYDQGEYCDIVMTSLTKCGDIGISVSTNGTAPSIARKLRIEFEELFDDEFTEFSKWLADFRSEMEANGKGPDERRKILREMMEEFKISGNIEYPKDFQERMVKK